MGLTYSFGSGGGLIRELSVIKSGLNRVFLWYCIGAHVVNVFVKT